MSDFFFGDHRPDISSPYVSPLVAVKKKKAIIDKKVKKTKKKEEKLDSFDDSVQSYNEPYVDNDSDTNSVHETVPAIVPAIEYYVTKSDYQRALDFAVEKDLKVVLPKDNEVFVDIDNNSQLSVFANGLRVLRKKHEEVRVLFTRSRNNKWHFYVRCDDWGFVTDFEFYERIVLSAMLGSDPGYVLISLGALKSTDSGVGVGRESMFFFEKKGTGAPKTWNEKVEVDEDQPNPKRKLEL